MFSLISAVLFSLLAGWAYAVLYWVPGQVKDPNDGRIPSKAYERWQFVTDYRVGRMLLIFAALNWLIFLMQMASYQLKSGLLSN